MFTGIIEEIGQIKRINKLSQGYDFEISGKKVLEGTVWIQGRRIETDQRRVTQLQPLYFEPPLCDADADSGNMQILLGYLETFQPVSRRGLTFYPSTKFSLYIVQHGLGLFMQQDKDWASAEAIDVFYHSYFPATGTSLMH